MTNQGGDRNQEVILLVEDNPAHAGLVFRSLEECGLAHAIHHVSDGEAALNYLFRRGNYVDPARSPRPQLILLDLRLPKIDGLEVLKQIKAAPDVSHIPVVVLTTSAAEQDLNRAYDQRANSYLVKPVDFNRFSQLMQSLCRYWLGWNEQPC